MDIGDEGIVAGGIAAIPANEDEATASDEEN